MAFVYAIVIGGAICALTQLLTELKCPFPLTALIMMVLGGGLLTYTGTLNWLLSLGAGGVAATAVGCGNGAYSAGTQILTGSAAPLILCAALNIILVLLGALAGGRLLKKHPECLPPEEAVKK